MKTETGKVNPDCNPTTEGITAPVITIPVEAALYHNTWMDTVTT